MERLTPRKKHSCAEKGEGQLETETEARGSAQIKETPREIKEQEEENEPVSRNRHAQQATGRVVFGTSCVGYKGGTTG